MYPLSKTCHYLSRELHPIFIMKKQQQQQQQQKTEKQQQQQNSNNKTRVIFFFSVALFLISDEAIRDFGRRNLLLPDDDRGIA